METSKEGLAGLMKPPTSTSWRAFWRLVDEAAPWTLSQIEELRQELVRCGAIRDRADLVAQGLTAVSCEELGSPVSLDLDGVIAWWSLLLPLEDEISPAAIEQLNGPRGAGVIERMRILFDEVTSESGHYLVPRLHRLYVLASESQPAIKVGLTHRSSAEPRLAEISRKDRIEGLAVVAEREIGPLDDQEAEHTEWSVRQFLWARHGFRHSGKVDWMLPSEGFGGNWQSVLDEATDFVLSMGGEGS